VFSLLNSLQLFYFCDVIINRFSWLDWTYFAILGYVDGVYSISCSCMYSMRTIAESSVTYGSPRIIVSLCKKIRERKNSQTPVFPLRKFYTKQIFYLVSMNISRLS